MIDGKYFAIDSHCHIYPEKIASLAVSHTDGFYDIKSYHKGTIEDLIENGEKAGIDVFLVQSVATTPKQVKSINEFIYKNVQNSNGKLIGLGAVHPESADIKGDFEHLLELGLKGIKIHPDIQNFKIDDPRFMKMYELCEEAKIPVLFHTGDSRYDNSNPNRLIPILKEFKNLIVVGAHFGGWSIWEEASKKLCEFENFYVDCSSSFYYITFEKAKEIILRYGFDKVLFATDYPMWNAQTEIKTLLDMNFTTAQYEKLFSENAKKVYNLKV